MDERFIVPATSTVSFSWFGSQDGPAGFALYTVHGTNFLCKLYLPSVKKAQQIHAMLCALQEKK